MSDAKDEKKKGGGSKAFGKKIWDASYKVSDKLAVYANGASKKLGSEAFWPSAGDTKDEIEKCARILQTFTQRGVPETITKEQMENGQKVKKQQKVLKKIPASAIRQAKGIAIYTAFRTAIAPLGGAGGSGILMSRLPDGSWSAPVGIMPNNLSTGFMWGADIYDVVLILRTEKAVQSFYKHKFTVGGEMTVAAGPVGAGVMLESGKEAVPCWSYVKSRGFYAGVELNGTIIVMRTDEAARFYYKREITAEQILTGGVHMPYEAKPLHQALEDAENRSDTYAMNADEINGVEVPDDFELEEGETLRLPPTPDMLSQEEGMDFREAWERQQQEEQRLSLEEKRAHDDDEKIFPRQTFLPPPSRTPGSIPTTPRSSTPIIPPTLPARPSGTAAPGLPARPTGPARSESSAPPAYEDDTEVPAGYFTNEKDNATVSSTNEKDSSTFQSLATPADETPVYAAEPSTNPISSAQDELTVEERETQEQHESDMIQRLTLDETGRNGSETAEVLFSPGIEQPTSQTPLATGLPPAVPPRRRPVPPPPQQELV